MNLALSKPLPRRAMLRGIGAALALPWFESMNRAIAKPATLKGPPLRCAFLFAPNGTIPDEWTPKGSDEARTSNLPRSWACNMISHVAMVAATFGCTTP